MKKILIVGCLICGYSYGMDCKEEADVASTSKATYEVKNIDRSVKIDLNNPNLIDQWQDISDVVSEEGSEDNIFDTSLSTYKEGRFWTVVRKVFQPLQITANASTLVLITASEVAKSSYPSVSTGLSYGALGSAVTSGVLSLFISKMNSKISKLNKTYKTKLASESKRAEEAL